MGGEPDPGIESRIRRLMADRVPGLSAAVVRADGVRWLRGLGVADLADQAPATPDTIYLWFSMTKIVTATASLRLADGGQLSLGDPVVRHYPQFTSLGPAERAARVTVRHLLSHSAGLATRSRSAVSTACCCTTPRSASSYARPEVLSAISTPRLSTPLLRKRPP
jgi:CubicO group peptidase (beta-lactamase class C family)